MKKAAYVVGGFVLGIVVATSSSAFAAQIKSLVGQKVTGEVNVVVNGKTLNTKGAIINNTTNVPARAISDAIGGKISLDGNTVNITTESNVQKTSLLLEKDTLEKSIAALVEERKETERKYNESLIPGTDRYEAEAVWKASLDSIDKKIAEKQAQLDKINAALTSLGN